MSEGRKLVSNIRRAAYGVKAFTFYNLVKNEIVESFFIILTYICCFSFSDLHILYNNTIGMKFIYTST